MNLELPDIQAGFRKGRGTRDQIAITRWFIEKAREVQKNIYFCFIDYGKAFVWITTNCGNKRDGNTRSPTLPPEKSVCRSRSNGQSQTWNNGLVQNWERGMSKPYIVTLNI